MRMASKNLVRQTLIAAFALIAGFILAVVSFHVEFMIDYDSGAQVEVMRVGPFKVRSQVLPSQFGSLSINDDASAGLSGKPEWHTTGVFVLNSKYSASYEGTEVLKHVRQMELLFDEMSNKVVKQAKRGYLRALANGGTTSAREVVQNLKTIEFERSTKVRDVP